jgi:hypothetical protein
MSEQSNGKVTTRYYLNALRHDETKKLPPPFQGKWKDDENFLVNYADSIDVSVQLSSTEMAHSVPSIFQRPMQFYWALDESKRDPLRRTVTSEWRGLMAVVGLAAWMKLDLQLSKFVVPPINDDEWSYVGNESAGDLHFRAMLRNQLPLRPVNGMPENSGDDSRRASDWENWWVIRCGRTALGATSPWTLVYTAAQYQAPAGIPWQKDGVLIDPIRYYDPEKRATDKPQVLSALHAWVKALIASKDAKLWGIPAHLSSQETVVVKALKAWLEELKPYENQDLAFRAETSSFPEAPLSNILVQIDGLKPADGNGAQGLAALHRSDVFIASRDGRDVVVLSSVLPPTTCIYDGVFATGVSPESLPATGDQIPVLNGKPIDCEYIVAEKLLFPPKLVRLLAKNKFLGGQQDLSVPLTPEYVEYFGFPDSKNIPLAQEGEGAVARIRVPLRNGNFLRVEKHYSKADIVSFEGAPPAFAIWPDCYDENWRHGFAAFSSHNRGDIRVKTISAEGILSGESETARAGAGQKDACIWPCSTPVIGFALEVGETAGRAEPAGLVLRPNLERPPSAMHNLHWRVAVDFGTSSTTVMVDKGNGATDLVFAGRTLFLSQIAGGGPQDAFDNISANLYPSESRQPPFLTLLYDTVATILGNVQDPYTLRFTSSAPAPGGGQPVRNIKWGRYTGDASTNPLMVYLTALVRYIVWEARMEGVEQLDFCWSYPLSLPVGSHTLMQNFWSKVRHEYADTGMRITATPSGMPESEAICRALCADKQNKSVLKVLADGLTIAVDVGGGSTDIAFWSGSKLLDQVSFKLAGSNILDRQYLSEVALDSLFEACNRTPPTASRQDFIDNAEIYLNDALTEAKVEKKENAAAFRNRDPRLHPIPKRILGGQEASYPWQQFRSMIYLFFTGISYYLGVHARTLKVKEEKVDIYFGGRGSAFLTWLHGHGEEVAKLLEYAFQCGLDSAHDDNTQLYFRDKKRRIEFLGLPFADNDHFPPLKTEVVRGLLRTELDLEVLSSEGIGTEGEKLGSCVAGEIRWTLNGEPIDWGHRLRAVDLANLHYPDASAFESTTIGHFMGVLLRAEAEKERGFIHRFSLDAANLKSLSLEGTNVHQLILESAQQFAKQGECVCEPIFAYELNDLMDQYAEKVNRSQKGAKATA